MRSNTDTYSSSSFDIKRLAIYKEALHLFTLSRKLSKHQSRAILINCPIKEELATQLSEHITSSALSLPFSIAEAAVTVDFYKQLHFHKTIEERIERILNLSARLEELYHNGDQRVTQLMLSASDLKRGFKSWSNQLTFQN